MFLQGETEIKPQTVKNGAYMEVYVQTPASVVSGDSTVPSREEE